MKILANFPKRRSGKTETLVTTMVLSRENSKKRAPFAAKTAAVAFLSAAFVPLSPLAAQTVYYSDPYSQNFAPQFPQTFPPNAATSGGFVLPGETGVYEIPNAGPNAFGSPNISEFSTFSGFSNSGAIPWNGDINSVPILEMPQPNAPRKLPTLQVPQTPAELDARFSALKKRFANPPLSIQNSSPGRLLRYSLIAGADQTFLAPNPDAQNSTQNQSFNANSNNPADLRPMYALGALCWNFPCANRVLFRVVDGRPIPAIGYDFQSKRGELLAALAFAQVDRKYEIRVEDQVFTVDDLIAWEKRACSTGADLSLVAVGLAFYSQNADETWTNELGEEWSLFKLLESEIARPVDWGSTESTDKLLGLTYLLARLKQGQNAAAPQTKHTEEFLVAIKGRIWEIFNGEPLSESLFFDAETKVSTPFMKLYVNGALFRWLATTASPEEIASEKTARAAAEICALVDQLFNSVDDLDKLSPTDEESLGVAMQALSIYQKRLGRQNDAR